MEMITVGQTQGGGNYQEAPVTSPHSLLCTYTCVLVGLHAEVVCAGVPIHVSPVCVEPLCSFSTMKSFLKPVNNVKGKHRGEVEPPSWVPVLHWLGRDCSHWPGLLLPRPSSTGKHQAWKPQGPGEQRWLRARGPPSLGQPAGLFIFFNHCLFP